jgi:phenylalanyl-tRNA synthetase beta chain
MDRITKVLGVPIEANRSRAILEALGCETVSADARRLVVRVPSFRGDLEREIDLIEEVARCHGYDGIPAAANVPYRMAHRDDILSGEKRASEVLTAAGFYECVTFSFTDAESARLIAPWTDAPPIEVRNPIDRERPGLRTSVIPGLLAARRLNQARRNEDVRLFELAHVYLPRGKGELPDERRMLGLVADVDFRTMKGVVEAVLARFGLADDVKTDETKMDFLAEAVALSLGGERLGYLGVVSEKTVERYDLKGQVAAAEIDFGRVMREAKPATTLTELPRFPEIDRDLAVVVDETVRWADIRKVIDAAHVGILERVTFLSEFRGKQIPPGKKSIAFSMVFRSPDRTLTREEADGARDTVLKALEKELRAELRQ